MNENIIGTIQMFAFDYDIDGWMVCNGRQLPVKGEYEALYAVIGVNFGGSYSENYNIPNYMNLAPTGSQYFIAWQGSVVGPA